VKGVHSLGSAGCGEKEKLEDQNCCGSRTWVLGMLCVESGQLVGQISLWTHSLNLGVACC
jgi:hypothetical protein